jgi:hypothetical protein
MQIACYPSLIIMLLVTAAASAQQSARPSPGGKPPQPARQKPVVRKQPARELLTARLWRIRRAQYVDGSIMEETLPGNLHIKLTGTSFALDTSYRSDGAHLIVSFRNDGTASLRSMLPGESQTHVATWSLSADEKRLTLTQTGGRSTEYRIDRLDSSQAILVVVPADAAADARPARLARLELVPQE